MNIPILGICYGMQRIVTHFGENVQHQTIREYGQISKIEDPIKVYINEEYTFLSYPVIHGDGQVVYYNIAFNSKNEISGLFTTLILPDRNNN